MRLPGALRKGDVLVVVDVQADFVSGSLAIPGAAAVIEPLNAWIDAFTLAEGRESYRVETYGRVVAVTRQVLINDDLDAFTRIPAMYGNSIAQLESDAVWGIITSNPNMGDGVALFHANHANLLTGAGTALALTGLGSAMAAMAKQKRSSYQIAGQRGTSQKREIRRGRKLGVARHANTPCRNQRGMGAPWR